MQDPVGALRLIIISWCLCFASLWLPAHAGTAQITEVEIAQFGTFQAELHPVQVWTPDAEIWLNQPGGAPEIRQPPQVNRLAGRLIGEPGSRVVLTELPDGRWRGLLSRQGEFWLLPETAPGRALLFENVPGARRTEAGEFQCQTRTPPREVFRDRSRARVPDRVGVSTSRHGHDHTARIALETDRQFLDRFNGDITEALTYLGDLFAFISSIYVDEVKTSLALTHVSLWPDDDPWHHQTIGCGLYETGGFWNMNRTDIDRSVMHFVSGKSGGGVAWLGAMCAAPFPVNHGSCNIPPVPNNHYGGDYAASAGIVGGFDVDNPGAVWDLVVIAHELGHNFGSSHTHCYKNVGGISEPVDRCYDLEGGANCNNAPAELPGPAGQGSGTIMSYCHLHSGGISNMSPTLGQGHPWGVEPGRVPDVMDTFVDFVAGSLPECVAPLDGFQLTVAPAEVDVCADTPALEFDLLAYTASPLDDPIEMSIESLPEGLSASFDPPTIDAPGATTLTVDVHPDAVGGDHLLNLIATAGALEANLPVRIGVRTGDELPVPTLVSPPAGELAVTPGMYLEWSAQSEASEYHVQIASDAAFEHVLWESNVTEPRVELPSLLEFGTEHFWRVASASPCGRGSFSESRNFGTSHAICKTVETAIPDNDENGLESVFIVREHGHIEGFKLLVRIDHEWAGDLRARLTPPGSTDAITLFDRPDFPDRNWGCDGAGIDAVFDDEAEVSVQQACSDSTPAISGWLRPLEPLTGVDGLAVGGTWRLNIADLSEDEVGQLTEWCLLPGLVDGEKQPIFRDRFENID